MSDYTVRKLFQEMPRESVGDVRLQGWVRTARESKNFAFIELNDGTYFRNLQLVLEEERLPGYRELLKQIGVGAAIEAAGTLEIIVISPWGPRDFPWGPT